MVVYPVELVNLCRDNPWRPHDTTGTCLLATKGERSRFILNTALGSSNEAGFHAGANPNLSAKDRLKIASTQQWSTEAARLGLVLNPAATQPELDVLSRHDDSRVRVAVAKHASHWLSLTALEELSKDHTVAFELAQVPKLPEWAYRNIIAQDMPSSVWNLRIVAENPSAPVDFLTEMASGVAGRGGSFEEAAIRNPSTPIGVILGIRPDLHVRAIEEVVDWRRREVEAWFLERHGVEISLDDTPYEWVRDSILAITWN